MVFSWWVTSRLPVISLGQACVNGDVITFRGAGGTMFNEFTGNKIEFDRTDGVRKMEPMARLRDLELFLFYQARRKWSNTS